MSKAALERMFLSLAEEVRPANIAVNVLSPGRVDTWMNRRGDWPGTAHIPMAQPEAIMPAAIWLAQQSAASFTGQVVERADFGVTWGPQAAETLNPNYSPTREIDQRRPFWSQRILNTTVFQDYHAPKASSSAGLGSVRISLSVVLRRTSSGQPPWADNHRFTLEPPKMAIALTRPAASGVHTLTTLNSASIPVPPDMTRATQS